MWRGAFARAVGVVIPFRVPHPSLELLCTLRVEGPGVRNHGCTHFQPVRWRHSTNIRPMQHLHVQRCSWRVCPPRSLSLLAANRWRFTIHLTKRQCPTGIVQCFAHLCTVSERRARLLHFVVSPSDLQLLVSRQLLSMVANSCPCSLSQCR